MKRHPRLAAGLTREVLKLPCRSLAGPLNVVVHVTLGKADEMAELVAPETPVFPSPVYRLAGDAELVGYLLG
jgi:hypothetical protein